MADNDWTQPDVTSLRTLLGQPTGQKLLKRLRSSIPRITSDDINKATLEAVRKQGAEDLYDFLLSHIDEIPSSQDSIIAPVDLTREGD